RSRRLACLLDREIPLVYSTGASRKNRVTPLYMLIGMYMRTSSPPVPAPPPVVARQYYRRAMIARRLKVSVSTVIRWEQIGDLTPIRGLDGWSIFFDPAEVDRLEEKYPPKERTRRTTADPEAAKVGGKAAARVFALLKEKRSFADIVIETGLEPWHVREIERQYKLGGLEGAEKERARARNAADERKRQQAHEREQRLEAREQMKAQTKEERARK